MEVPIWVLKNTAYRLSRRPEPWEAFKKPNLISMFAPKIVCARCSKDLKRLPRIFLNNATYCSGCHQEIIRGIAVTHGYFEVDGLPKGNLSEAEFQFWQGSRLPTSLMAKCRGCQTTVLGVEGRQVHMKAKYEGDVSCTTLLLKSYATLRRKPVCAVCKGYTVKQKWGVPLCGRKCIETWKFEDRMYLGVEMELMQVRREMGLLKLEGNDAAEMEWKE